MRRPWNRVNEQIYSLSTVDKDGKANMNICTYVTPISMKPKLYAIALYYNTKTLLNIQQNKKALLQILAFDHFPLVKKLGMTSALSKSNKMKSIEVKKYDEFVYMPNVLAIIELHFTQLIEVEGDHLLGIAKVVSYKQVIERKPLTLNDLREKKIIR